MNCEDLLRVDCSKIKYGGERRGQEREGEREERKE